MTANAYESSTDIAENLGTFTHFEFNIEARDQPTKEYLTSVGQLENHISKNPQFQIMYTKNCDLRWLAGWLNYLCPKISNSRPASHHKSQFSVYIIQNLGCLEF